MQTILGIDPGSRIIGYGIIQSDGLRHYFVSCGCIRITAKIWTERLKEIFDGLCQIISQYKPDVSAVEQVFMHQNAGAALKLGQARGAAIAAAALYTIPVAEYSARQVKQAVVGYGAAQKTQVQHMIQTLLKLNKKPSVDAADALAVAVCHAHANFGMNQIGICSKNKG